MSYGYDMAIKRIHDLEAQLQDIETNRDSWRIQCHAHESEIDRLKAELEATDLDCGKEIAFLHKDRDFWKAKAEKLAQILQEEVVEGIDWGIARLRAKEALAEFEEGNNA